LVGPATHRSRLAGGCGGTVVTHNGTPASSGCEVLKRGVLQLPEGLAELPRSELGFKVAPVSSTVCVPWRRRWHGSAQQCSDAGVT
jgi:hypothetical protein